MLSGLVRATAPAPAVSTIATVTVARLSVAASASARAIDPQLVPFLSSPSGTMALNAAISALDQVILDLEDRLQVPHQAPAAVPTRMFFFFFFCLD